MSPFDYQRVEQELQKQLHPLSNFQMAGLQGVHGWSTAALGSNICLKIYDNRLY